MADLQAEVSPNKLHGGERRFGEMVGNEKPDFHSMPRLA
jgi:hypothetical protein